MVEPSSTALPMLAAGQNANSDNANDGPIKHRNNFRRFPPAQGPTDCSKQSGGGNRPFRGRRHDRPRENRSSEDRSHSDQRHAPKPDQDVSRRDVNDTYRSQGTLSESESPASGARPRREPQRRGPGRSYRGSRNPQPPRNPAVVPEGDRQNRETHRNRQDNHDRPARDWPRIPRSSNVSGHHHNENRNRPSTNETSSPQHFDDLVSNAVEPRMFNPSRGRPHRYSRGRGRFLGVNNRRNEPSDAQKAPENAQSDPTVIIAQASSESVTPVKEPPSAELPKKLPTAEEIFHQRDREIQQFKTRFPKSFAHAEDTYLFTFAPTDPDWVFDVRSIQLKVQFPSGYPSVPFSIVVVNTDDVLPPLLVEDIDKAILKWIEFFHKPGQLSFRPFLRWIDRNLQEIFVESLRKIKKLQERPSVVLVDQENLKPCANNSSSERGSSDEDLDLEGHSVTTWGTKALPRKQKRLEELDDLFDDAVRPKVEVQKVASHGPVGTTQLAKIFNNYDPHTPPRRGIEVKFRHVDFSESVSFVVCDRLLVSVQCKKCKKIADFQLLPGRRSVSHCAKCQTTLEACFGPSILLQFNPLLGYLELKECTIRDVALSRCHFYADCQNCTKLSPLEGVHLGQRGSSHCLNCNLKMTFVMDSFKYMDMCAIEANIKASNIKKANKDSAIQAGKPLPSNGACKHYKKSFRWFRFPCCGKAYPCDVCHDAAEDHDSEFASRMICGFCAKEQPFSNDKPCTQCSSMITGRRTAHWEGGKGCRNQLKMNTNDSKKFAGMSKTVSRKSTATKAK